MRGIWIGVLAGVLISPTVGGALPFIAEVVVDTSTPVPNGTGEFAAFFEPAMSGTDIVFRGIDEAGNAGVYLATADGVCVVADTSTRIPGTTDTFGTGLLNAAPAISQGAVAFLGGSGESGIGPRFGVYHWTDGELTEVADRFTPVPEGSGTFIDFGVPTPSIDKGTVAFAALSGGVNGITGNEGIYTRGEDETLRRIIDASEPPTPGSRIPIGFSQPVIRGDEIVFGGLTALVVEGPGGSRFLTDTRGSVFLLSDGEVEEILSDTFANGISFLGDTIAIRAFGSTSGIVVFEDGVPRVVADTLTEIPGGSGTFTVFNGGPWVTAEGIYFEGSRFDPAEGLQKGIFLARDGVLYPVVGIGDSLVGATVADLDLLIGGFENDPNGVAFRVAFEGGKSAIVIAAVIPEPQAMLLFAVGAWMVGKLGRWKG